jgi:hypothetical protein
VDDRPSVIEIRVSRRMLSWVVGIFLAIVVLFFLWLALQTLGGHASHA